MTLALEQQPLPLTANEDGAIRVGDTRVTLDTVVYAFKEGLTAEEIVSRYSVLQLSDVYAAIAYYLNNRTAVEVYLRQREEEAEEIRRLIEAQPGYKAFRERLLARHRERQAND